MNPLSLPSSYATTSHSLTPSESYNKLPFDSVDPEVYRSRNNRSMAKLGHPEKWQGFTRAYWCIVCSYCHKEVRFCCMCQGELKPVDKEKNDGIKHLQCTECHRVVSMRFCSTCGHQYEDKVVDARMEIPGINVIIMMNVDVIGRSERIFWYVISTDTLHNESYLCSCS